MSTKKKSYTQDELNAWKEKYPKCDIMEVLLTSKSNPDKQLEIVIRTPDRRVIGFSSNEANPNKANDIMVNACVLTNLDKVKADDDFYFGALEKIMEHVPGSVNTSKKL